MTSLSIFYEDEDEYDEDEDEDEDDVAHEVAQVSPNEADNEKGIGVGDKVD